MADFTREELAAFRNKIMSGGPDQALEVSPEAVLRLLAMASRAVSEETLRLVAVGFAEADGPEYEKWRVDMVVAVTRDLRPALARSAGEGKDG